MSLSIDDILFPGDHNRRESYHLGEQIRYLDQIIARLSNERHAPQQPDSHPRANGLPERAHTHAQRDCSCAFTLISTREPIAYRVSEQVPNIWCAWDDNDTSGKGGWGSSADEAVADLLDVLS